MSLDKNTSKCVGDFDTPSFNIKLKGKKQPKHSSKYMGVYWNKANKKWASNISFREKGVQFRKHLGFFDVERDAAIMYDKMAIRLGLPTNILTNLTTTKDDSTKQQK